MPCGRAVVEQRSRPFFLIIRKAARAWESGRGALGLLGGSQPYFSSGESSRRGKAGAAWGCRPTEHPLPTPAGNPAGSRIHSSSHGSGFAFAVSSESRPASFGMDVGTRCGLQGWTCPGEELRKATSNCGTAPLDGHRGAMLPAFLAKGRGVRKSDAPGRLIDRRRSAQSSLTRQAASFSTRDNSPRSPARCDALGRRAREAVPDSRAEAKGLGSA